jgi:hypothetical protein
MVSTFSAVIRISIEGGVTSKIGKARFGKCRLTITPPGEKNFQKKIGGRGPTGPPTAWSTNLIKNKDCKANKDDKMDCNDDCNGGLDC